MHRRTSLTIVSGAGLLLSLVVLALVWSPLGAWLHHDVEAWLADQLRVVARNELVPRLEFTSLEYAPPYSVTLRDARLVADDGTVVVEAASLQLTLAEIPEQGEPLQIAEVVVDDAKVRLHVDPEGGLVGFSPLLRDPPRDAEVTASQIFRLHAVALHDVDLELQVEPDASPMVLDGLTAELSLQRDDATTDASGEVWYGYSLRSGRGDALRLRSRGMVSLDHWQLRTDDTTLMISVDRDTIDSLPPVIRAVTDEHEAHGSFQARVRGQWDLAAPDRSLLHATVGLRDFGLALDPFTLEASALDAEVVVLPGLVTVPSLRATVLGSTVQASATLGVAEDHTLLSAHGSVRGLPLRRLVGDSDGSIAGRLYARGQLHGDLETEGDLRGRATVRLENGRILEVPLVSAVVDAVGRGPGGGGAQRGRAVLSWHGEHVAVEQLQLDTPLLGVTGDGHMGIDGSLDLRVAAGPLHRSDRGAVARGLATVGQQLWSYRIDGTLQDPRVRPRPLSIGNRG